MKIRIGYDIAYECVQPTPFLFTLNVHPSRQTDLLSSDALQTEPAIPTRQYLDTFGNRVTRATLPAGRTRIFSEAMIVDSGALDPIVPSAPQLPVEDLPAEVLLFLLGSRYCETDKLSELAWSLFGTTQPGWPRVQAIVEYVHNHVTFGYQHARPTKSASDVHVERAGVCRDFAHLAVTLTRCMSIPARYCTGYLGDIGVPYDPAPMDFSAWFEAYLGGRWYTFDARHNKPRIGRILMATGRDASDVAISNSFGVTTLAGFKVWTDEIV